MLGRLIEWGSESFWTFFQHLHPKEIREESLWFRTTLLAGALSLIAFLLLLGTGAYLMYYYVPSEDGAWMSVRLIENRVPYGSMVRSLHNLAAQLMVVTVVLHLVALVLRGAHEREKLANWLVGTVLFVLTVALAYTGYLLPFDQLAYWATMVGVNMAASAPVAGKTISVFLMGGESINTDTLLRFYVHHCITVPIAFVVLLSVHMYRIRRDKGLTLPWWRERPDPKWVKTQPVLLHWEILAFSCVSLVLAAMAFFLPTPLGPEADPGFTPNPMKAPWYLVGLQELLHFHPPFVVSYLITGALILGMALLPIFKDEHKRMPLSELPVRIVLTIEVALLAVALASLFTGHYADYVTSGCSVVAMVLLWRARVRPSGVLGWLPFPTFLVFYALTTYAGLTFVGHYLRGPGWKVIW